MAHATQTTIALSIVGAPKDIDNAVRATSCTAMTRVGHCRQKLPASGSLPSLLNVSKRRWNPSMYKIRGHPLFTNFLRDFFAT